MNGHTYEIILALGLLSPLVSFWILVFWGSRLGKPGAGWTAVLLGMGLPLVCATYVLVGWLGALEAGKTVELAAGAFRYHWADLGAVPVTIGSIRPVFFTSPASFSSYSGKSKGFAEASSALVSTNVPSSTVICIRSRALSL